MGDKEAVLAGIAEALAEGTLTADDIMGVVEGGGDPMMEDAALEDEALEDEAVSEDIAEEADVNGDGEVTEEELAAVLDSDADDAGITEELGEMFPDLTFEIDENDDITAEGPEESVEIFEDLLESVLGDVGDMETEDDGEDSGGGPEEKDIEETLSDRRYKSIIGGCVKTL